jgi:hypothetical protein
VRLPAALAAVVLVAAIAVGASAQANLPTQYEVKAAFLYNFAKFVIWPKAAELREDAPFVITVLGDDPFGEAWRVLDGKMEEGHPLVVTRASRIEELPPTQILFIGASERVRLAAVLDAVRGKPVLTIGDTPGFAEAGVMINFLVAESRVAFEINHKSAAAAPLQISSRLLALGRTVPGGD